MIIEGAGRHGGVRVLAMADTHVPKRARDLPPALWAAVDEADVVLHAGDWISVALLDALESRARRLIGCYGNNDGPALRARLPEVARATLGGVEVAVVHETGQSRGREERCAAAYPDVDLLLFGHSHIPWDTVAPNGLRLLNPGSPTDRRRQPHHTYLTFRAHAGAITDVRLHVLPAQTSKPSPAASRR